MLSFRPLYPLSLVFFLLLLLSITVTNHKDHSMRDSFVFIRKSDVRVFLLSRKTHISSARHFCVLRSSFISTSSFCYNFSSLQRCLSKRTLSTSILCVVFMICRFPFRQFNIIGERCDSTWTQPQRLQAECSQRHFIHTHTEYIDTNKNNYTTRRRKKTVKITNNKQPKEEKNEEKNAREINGLLSFRAFKCSNERQPNEMAYALCLCLLHDSNGCECFIGERRSEKSSNNRIEGKTLARMAKTHAYKRFSDGLSTTANGVCVCSSCSWSCLRI